MAMSSTDHRAAAEHYLEKAKREKDPDGAVWPEQRNLLLAQVHATLALAPEPPTERSKSFETSREW